MAAKNPGNLLVRAVRPINLRFVISNQFKGFMCFKFGKNFFISMLIIFSCVCSFADSSEADEIKFEAGFIPEQNEILLGEPIFIVFFVTNTGTQTFYLETGGDYRGIRSSRFQFKAVDFDGRPAVDPNPEAHNQGGIVSNAKVMPRECYREKIYLPLWLKFDRAGDYVVRGRRLLQFSEKPEFSRNYALVHQLNADFELTIQPADIQLMGKRIEQLASLLDSSNGAEAARKLADIDD